MPFALILLTSFQLKAQFSCGFKPTTSQIQHYQSQLPVATSQQPLSNVSTSNYSIHVWVIKNNTVTNFEGPAAEDIQNTITGMNPAFNFSNGAHFSLCGITYVNDSNFETIDLSDYTKNSQLYSTYQKANEINCYILGSITGSILINGVLTPIPIGAYASYPGGIPILVFNQQFSIRTVSHEIGHFFGLFHTFAENGRAEEYVNQSNCSIVGDLLCDTPADPQPTLCQVIKGK